MKRFQTKVTYTRQEMREEAHHLHINPFVLSLTKIKKQQTKKIIVKKKKKK